MSGRILLREAPVEVPGTVKQFLMVGIYLGLLRITL
jgi:hypothetical protein